MALAAGAPTPLAAAATTDIPYAVEDGTHPNRADILELTGADLIAGDGNITFTSCSGTHQIKVWARNLATQDSMICFVAAGTGYLSVNIPRAFRIETYDRDLKANVSIDGTTENLTVPRDTSKGFGEANPADPKQAVLLEMRVTGTGTPVTPPPVGDTTYAFTGKLRIGETRSCTAVLVDPRWAVTAKSCFADKPAESIEAATGAPKDKTTIILGRADLNSTGTHTSTVSYLVPRPDRDLALVRLDQPANGITPVAISGAAPTANEALTLAGYGRTFDEWAPTKLHTSNLAAGATTATGVDLAPKSPADAAICKGDAGAPILRDNNGKPELVAIASQSLQGGCLGESTNETRTNAVAVRADNIKFGSRLSTGQQLRSGDSLVSASGALTMQSDGDLVIVSNAGRSLWSTRTGGNAGATAWFDAGGNLIVRNAADTATLWESKTAAPGGSAVLTDRGNLVIYNAQQQSLWSSGTAVRHDYNGDGRSDVGAWYAFPNAVSDATYTFLAKPKDASTEEGVLGAPLKSYTSSTDKWNESAMKSVTGDFNGDGRGDIATLHGNSDASVTAYVALGQANGGFSEPTHAWAALPGGEFHISYMTPQVGDFNGDGRDDLAVWSANAKTGVTKLFTFTSKQSGTFNTPFESWIAPAGSWARSSTKFVTGDFNGDGREELSVFYKQGTQGVKAYVFDTLPNGGFAAPGLPWWESTAWHWENATPQAGDFDGDGHDDVLVWYSYDDGADRTSTMLFEKVDGKNKFGSAKVTLDGAKTYDVARMQMVTGDYNGDGRDDLAVMNHRADNSVQMITWTTKADAMFNGGLIGWTSNPGAWSFATTKLLRSYN
ncbi:trypsin-like serine protease (plasmid) [Streptomyces sp. S501]|uniref:FG-GAP-like repeat-containing protein n=1 Tax=Streptomyces sp. S501 TaxID=2420135 RepID=UPI00106E84F2|nr:FG-GAP-like repeat-containing protein [Streptomyces sp. S501]QBR04512.1 trypsin-like serine protease [Streptomyces sp. S501]